MPRYRWLTVMAGVLLLGVLFLALAQVREAHGRRGLIRFIPAAADADAPEIKLPEERNPPQPAPVVAETSVPQAAPAQSSDAAVNPPAAPECPPCEPEAPCEIDLPLEPERSDIAPPPPLSPPPAPKSWPLLGPQITDALLHALAAEDQSFLGYRPNDLIIGRVMDNRTNFQRGLFKTATEELGLLVRLNENPRSPAAGSLEQALKGDLQRWWFPSGEKNLLTLMNAAREFGGGMAGGAVSVPASDENLGSLFRVNANLLGITQGDLVLHQGFFNSDNAFYEAQGTAAAALAVLDAANLSFKTAIADSGTGPELDEARKWLNQAAHLHPVVVMNNDTTGSHLLVMAYYLERAEDALRAAADKLPGPDLIGK